jgi:hypothetical protein
MKSKRLPTPPYNPDVRDLVAGKRAWSRPLAKDEIERGFRGWHENGYLPHRDEPGLVQFVTLRLVDAWKGYTAKKANKVLGRKGAFWQEGYWDTYMRDLDHEARAQHYIENNPSKAKLVALPREWAWSSARFRDAYERLCLPEG